MVSKGVQPFLPAWLHRCALLPALHKTLLAALPATRPHRCRAEQPAMSSASLPVHSVPCFKCDRIRAHPMPLMTSGGFATDLVQWTLSATPKP